MADPASYRGNYGVALTQAELADLEARLLLEDHAVSIREYAADQPTFAGVWIDQPAGGIVKVAFKGDAERHRAEVERRAPGSPLRLLNVTYSLDELEEVLSKVEAARISLKKDGIWIRDMGIDPSPNRVEVAIEHLTDAAAETLRARFGDAIVVEQSGHPTLTACTDRYHCAGPPIRAGIATSSGCSLAFLVKRNGVPGTQWLSAGHCGSTGSVWSHNGTTIGTVRHSCWPDCTYSDALRGGELNDTYASYHVYLTPSSKIKVNSHQGLNGDVLGMQACLNARRELDDVGWRCGIIDEIRRVDYVSVYFLEQRYATYNSYNGDSGGAVHSPLANGGVIAYGVQSGCEDFTPAGGAPGWVNGCETWETNGRGIYSHIYRVRTELNVHPCTVAAPCGSP